MNKIVKVFTPEQKEFFKSMDNSKYWDTSSFSCTFSTNRDRFVCEIATETRDYINTTLENNNFTLDNLKYFLPSMYKEDCIGTVSHSNSLCRSIEIDFKNDTIGDIRKKVTNFVRNFLWFEETQTNIVKMDKEIKVS